MKRIRQIVAIILVIMAILAISACGSKHADEIVDIDSVPNTELQLQTTEPNTEFQLQATEPNTTITTEEKYIILKSNGFTDSGVAWVECCDKMGYPYLALINTDGEILYKHDNGGSIESYEDVESGMGMIDDGQYNFINDKGEIIKTFDKSDFIVLAVGGGQALFYDIEDGIDGFKRSIAVLGNDGNWTLDFQELNVDDVHSAYSDYIGCNMFKICIYSYFDNYDNRDWLILNGKTGGITYIENSLGEIRFENDVAYITDDISDNINPYSKIYGKEDNSDMLTLQDTCAVLDVDGNFKATGFSLKASYVEDGYFTGDSYCVVDKSTCSWRYSNCETNVGAFIENYEVDRVENITDVGNNYLVEIKGEDRNMYFTVMDINGKELFEPVKYDSVGYREDFILYSEPDEDSLIAIDYSGNEIRRFDYDSIGTFNCGLAVAEKSTENGDTMVVFINSEGEEIIPELYE